MYRSGVVFIRLIPRSGMFVLIRMMTLAFRYYEQCAPVGGFWGHRCVYIDTCIGMASLFRSSYIPKAAGKSSDCAVSPLLL